MYNLATRRRGLIAQLKMPQLFCHELKFIRHPAKLGKRTGFHLLHEIAPVNFHRCLADADVARNLFAETTPSDVDHDFTLTGSKGFEALPKGPQRMFVLAPCTIASNAHMNRLHEFLRTKRLRQE